MRKKQTEEMLSACANGTFLLRFSDSELGGVTIAWVSGEFFLSTIKHHATINYIFQECYYDCESFYTF